MLDQTGNDLVPKQIEINTIAASFGGLGTRLRGYHTHLLKLMGCGDISSQLPESRLDENYAAAMIECWRSYDSPGAVILFVIEETNRNIYDQRHIEHAIYRQCAELKVIWRTFRQLGDQARLDRDRLFVNQSEVALVYYRTGYVPDLYDNDKDWEVRLLMERSKAFICPCIHTHLVGCKKVQQVLCSPGVVEKYVEDKMAARIRRTFAYQYPTDLSPEGDAAVKLATANPDKYVLKTQREGGGNNVYGAAIVPELERMAGSEERGKYILMERIFPPVHDNYILTPEGGVRFAGTISEVGLYASSVWRGGKITANYCGQFYRTKIHGADEGGVMVGISSVDSLLLV